MATTKRVRELLATVKPLAAEYYRLTGKPLGVTGEIAEYVAAEILGLELAAARTTGYDAIRETTDGKQRIQIKGRAYGEDAKPGQRMGRIKSGAPCDLVLLVLLDNATLEPREMWEAPYHAVVERLAKPGSKARNERGAVGIAEFKRMAQRVWPDAQPAKKQAAKVCPECGREFVGSFGGIDAHWRANHEQVMPYDEARQSILSGSYRRR
jgi:hypothetical protein